MIATIAAALVLTAGLTSAEMKLGRTGERGKSSNKAAAPVFGSQSSVHAIPAKAAPAAPSRSATPSRSAAAPRSFAAQQQQQQRAAPPNPGVQRSAYGGSGFRRSDDGGGAAPSGPQPQAGALIRTAGAGSKVEADNSHRWHAVEGGYPQPGGLALTNHQGVSRFEPDRLPGQGAGTNPFGSSGVSSHQSWLEGIGGNNNGPNINVNNGNTNGGGNGNGNGNR